MVLSFILPLSQRGLGKEDVAEVETGKLQNGIVAHSIVRTALLKGESVFAGDRPVTVSLRSTLLGHDAKV